METDIIGGSRYLLTFNDNASRRIVVYFLKPKTEVFETFRDYKHFAENQTEERIKRKRTNNGNEQGSELVIRTQTEKNSDDSDDVAGSENELDQSIYSDADLFMDEESNTDDERQLMESVPYWELVGSLQYLSQSKRPDRTLVSRSTLSTSFDKV
ncbi:uncharacterized protein LOC134284173 [Aedes albopictus]|uniref:Secreted protein n=1 Tax=Aedes albopictus TaxID=7160 RepID=A0ABM1YSN3_AEDAL